MTVPDAVIPARRASHAIVGPAAATVRLGRATRPRPRRPGATPPDHPGCGPALRPGPPHRHQLAPGGRRRGRLPPLLLPPGHPRAAGRLDRPLAPATGRRPRPAGPPRPPAVRPGRHADAPL